MTQPGDLWLLGDHRLLCGDSTNEEDVARLFDGTRAVLMATDPPYLVDYDSQNHPPSKSNTRPDGSIANKEWDTYHDPTTSVEFYASFLRVGIPHLEPHTAIYQWCASMRQPLVDAAWRQCKLLPHQVIIWSKTHGVLTRSMYMWSHEMAMYGWVEGSMPKLKPPANACTVWHIDQKLEPKGIHPTIKPLEIFLRPIEYHTRPGDIIYEPFSGSGTQLIAAEPTGRLCYAIDQEPQYVDVAIQRFASFSTLGMAAVALLTPEGERLSFEQVRAMRSQQAPIAEPA